MWIFIEYHLIFILNKNKSNVWLERKMKKETQIEGNFDGSIIVEKVPYSFYTIAYILFLKIHYSFYIYNYCLKLLNLYDLNKN